MRINSGHCPSKRPCFEQHKETVVTEKTLGDPPCEPPKRLLGE